MRFHLLGAAAIFLAAAAMVAASDAKAQEPRYDPATKIDVKATVTDVREVPATDMLPGLHLTVKCDAGTFDVYVGPSDFIKAFGGEFAKEDEVHVIGSRVKGENIDIILAREIDKGEVNLILRDEDGSPYWTYWKKT